MILERLDLGSVIEHVETLAAAREALRRGQYALVILDVQLPDGRGWDLADELLKTAPSTAVVICTAHGTPKQTVDARLSGVGYVEKFQSGSEKNPYGELAEALRLEIASALAGQRGTEERKLEVARDLELRCELTEREPAILELIAGGATHDEIAAETGIAKSTLNNALGPLFDKLEPIVRDRSLAGIALWISDHAHYLTIRERERRRREYRP